MFKKFHPKDDVSSSTSLKSSVQRGIRSAVLTQMPLLTQPATLPESNEQEPAEEQIEAEPEVEEEAPKKGKKGKGGGGKKAKGGKAKKEEVDVEEEAGDFTLIDEIWPKKEALGLTKCHDRISIYTVNTVPLFVQHFDGPFIPTLKLLHRSLLPHVQIDRGAIKFLLAGANMMAPGFLSAGGNLPDGLEEGRLVAIHAEGKEHACGIGKMSASSEEVKKAGKGVAVEVVTWIGDDLWKIDTIGL